MKSFFKSVILPTCLIGLLGIVLLQCTKPEKLIIKNHKVFRSAGYAVPSYTSADPSDAALSMISYLSTPTNTGLSFHLKQSTISFYQTTTGAVNYAVFNTSHGLVLIPISGAWHTINYSPLLIPPSGLEELITTSQAKQWINECHKSGVLLPGEIVEDLLQFNSRLDVDYGQNKNGAVSIYYSGSNSSGLSGYGGSGSFPTGCMYVCDSSALCPNNCDYY